MDDSSKPAAPQPSSEVVKCKKALAQLRRLYDDEHGMVQLARSELAAAEAKARATTAPDDLLRSAKDRFAAKDAEREQQQQVVTDMETKLGDATKRLAALESEVGVIRAEVSQAQSAVAAAAADAT
eukprot:5411677-Pyramimonas_sp.AAC.1